MKNSSSGTRSSKTSSCQACKKKSLILVSCKCSEQFCLSCRQPEYHACRFDYSETWKQQLEKDNPVIAREKISKI